MAITVTQIDSQSLNSVEGIRVHIVRNTSAGDFVATTTKRQRSRLTPAITNEVFESRRRIVHISPDPAVIDTSDPDNVESLDSTIHEIFMPWKGTRILYGTDHSGNNYTANIRINRFGRRSPHEWEAEFEFIDGVWKSATLNTETTSPLTVSGNVFAQPTITLSGGQAITRTRVTVTDRTGHGIMGYMISVSAPGASASNHLVYMNGIEIPFNLSSGRLFFRVAAPPPNGSGSTSTFIDIFYSTAITNTETADQLDAAGITLNAAVASGAFTTDPDNPFSKALASSLTWHPGIVTRHPRNRAYTFGFDGESQIRLVDRSATGTQYNLPDDADAYILSSPVEINSISDLSFDVTSQYVPGRNSSSGSGDERVMRVTISTIDGVMPPTGPILDSSHQRDLLSGYMDEFPSARNNYLFYSQFTFGDVTFPNTYSYDSRQDPESIMGLSMQGNPTYDEAFVQGTVWRNDYLPWEIQTLAETYLGCTVTTGADGVWYLHFPDGAFNGIEDLPLLSMSIHEKGGEWTVPNNDPGQEDLTIIAYGDASINDSILFESVWVDPDTLEPLDRADPDAPANEEPLAGTVTAFVAKKTRDSEDWVTVWEQTVAADGSNYSGTLTPTGLTGLNATQIAVGLKPASTNPNTIDSGTLTITTDPVITLSGSKTPSVSINSGLSAQLYDGTLTNTTTGKYIDLDRVVGNGIEIDTENLKIQASTGPFYGRLSNNGGVRLFDLEVGSNAWTEDFNGSPTVTFTWYDREAE